MSTLTKSPEKKIVDTRTYTELDATNAIGSDFGRKLLDILIGAMDPRAG